MVTSFMPQSPKGRRIRDVDGTPQTIVERGQAIETLGEQMLTSADTLEAIATRSVADGSQKGKAITALRDQIDDSYTTLRQAGELYKPVGPVIRAYGDELQRIQSPLNGSAGECQVLWTAFDNLPGADPRGSVGIDLSPQLQLPAADEEAQAEQDEDKRLAYERWETEAETFDTWYDAWETAYDDAVGGIEQELADSIEDSFWSGFAEVMGWVALGLGIAALVIGGPIIAALALVAGALYLAATIGQYVNGEASVTDIVLAGLGVFPIGKLSNLTKLMHFNGPALRAFGKGASGNLGNLRGLLSRPTVGPNSLVGLYRSGGRSAVIRQLGLGSQGYGAVRRTHVAFYIGNRAGLEGGLGAVRNLARLDTGLQFLGNLSRFNSWSGRLGGPSVVTPPWLGPLV